MAARSAWLVDVNAALPGGGDGGARLTAERQRVGITCVLAYSRDAVRFDPATGNERMLRHAEEATDIRPIAVVAPLRSGDPAMEVARLARAGAVGFRLESGVWRGRAVTPSGATDALLAAVARTGCPLMVPLAGWGDASAIAARTAALGIPVILIGAHYDTIVDDLSAAVAYPHIHLETSRLAHFRAVERVVATIGAERLLLGTGLPERPPSSSLNAVCAARIPEVAKRSILGANAVRLFGLATVAGDAVGQPPLPVVLDGGSAIDAHAHLPPVPWDVLDLRPDELADELATNGIARAAASSLEGILSDAASGNAATVAACGADARLLGYLVADPNELDDTRRQLRRWGDAPGIVGVKIHCQWSGHATGSRAIADLFSVLADHGRPVKIHVDGDAWDSALQALARRHPRLAIIAAHGGPGTPHVAAARVAATTDNVFLELASSFAGLTAVREVVRICGPERMVFGSDAPLLDPAFVLGTYADAGLDPATHRGVFHDTAVRLFGLAA